MTSVKQIQNAVNWFDSLDETAQAKVKQKCPASWLKEFYEWASDIYSKEIKTWVTSQTNEKETKSN